jgi:S-adenosylmethionine-diacylglycerol 3-amino-3-carboxypropyl transferase
MTHFFNTLNYSSSNEDGRSELLGLRLTPSDAVVTITGSGSRTLDLLLGHPGRIHSVDMNPCQTYLLELKLAGLRELDYEEWIGFLGVTPQEHRLRSYSLCRRLLSPEATAYWDDHIDAVERGVLFEGRWEKYFHKAATLLSIMGGKRIDRMFSAEDVSRQASIYEAEWNDAIWRSFVKASASKVLCRYAFRDPGFFQHVPRAFPRGSYLLERFDAAFRTRKLSESPFLSLLLRGKFDDHALPLHLRPENFDILRKSCDRISATTAPLDAFLLAQPPGSINAFSLSDVASYTSEEEYARIWTAVCRAAAPGARICQRQFLVHRELPGSAAALTTRDRTLEERLEREDDSTFYSFVVATVR